MQPEEIDKAYAVRPVPLKRFEAAKGPLAATWTLYNIDDLLTEIAGVVPVGCAPTKEDLHKCLEKTGFNKAVRVRMEVLAWKERLRIEDHNLSRLEAEYLLQVKKIKQRRGQIKYELEQTRNILRIPRNANIPAVS